MKKGILQSAAFVLGVSAAAVTQAATTSVIWGPITVDAMSGTHNLILTNQTKPCTNCYITAMQMELLDSSYNRANYDTDAMLHHAAVSNANGTDATCAGTFLGSVLGERIFASGNERTTLDLPSGYGYYVGNNDSWSVAPDIMNMSMSQKDFYLELSVTYESSSANLTEVKPIWLDVANCTTDSAVSIPSGYSDTHWSWTANDDYKIVAGAGHVHDYGISIALENDTDNSYICTSVAGYEENSTYAPASVTSGGTGHPADANEISTLDSDASYEGHIEDMTVCSGTTTVDQGDSLRLHARYNAPSSIDDAMGIMIMYAEPL